MVTRTIIHSWRIADLTGRIPPVLHVPGAFENGLYMEFAAGPHMRAGNVVLLALAVHGAGALAMLHSEVLAELTGVPDPKWSAVKLAAAEEHMKAIESDTFDRFMVIDDDINMALDGEYNEYPELASMWRTGRIDHPDFLNRVFMREKWGA